ncbi:CHAT domain-containing protein [Paucibacter sp. JuS9]|uniref:CHAT domain-containing protein n=1 Tax=Paucibacter sp. JuS9 TaxID=3228748 RepID=UPI003756634E
MRYLLGARVLLLRACGAWLLCLGCAWSAASFESQLREGMQLRRAGQLNEALALLSAAQSLAHGDEERMRAAGEFGMALAQARRTDEARVLLTRAYQLATVAARPAYALELGLLAAQARDQATASRYFEEARRSSDQRLRLAASLNLARTLQKSERLPALLALSADISRMGEPALSLNLGHQARELGATELAWRSIEQAHSQAAAGSRLQIEALDALAQLYEDQGRHADSLALDQAALTHLRPLPQGALGELAIALEWRDARLHKALGQPPQSLAAYQRAVDRIEALRADIPIDMDDGSSSFVRLFEPVYLGLAEALIDASEKLLPDQRAEHLRRARDAVELIKQTEMQDFLGDRCAVDAVKGGSATVIPAGTAVVYTVLLPERLELLVETRSGISRFTERIASDELRAQASRFAKALRSSDPAFMPQARQLYDRLLRPLEGLVTAQQLDTLVVVPDGALRLVPFAALHDGSRFAIDKFALSTVSGLSMTNTNASHESQALSLMAGVANFGPVVSKLVLSDAGRGLMANTAGGTERSLRESLALPGVTREIGALGKILPGDRLLDESFTVEAFSRAARSGRYRIVHVATHGVFGGDARSSFMLAYDDLLTLGNLQEVLGAEALRRHSLELLTLSACETAEGNERAPLGISGAAIRARAKSVLGTLWPVDDEAAVRVMERFYQLIADGRVSKAQALRQAQRELLAERPFAHPFFWAPFSLIGNWL